MRELYEKEIESVSGGAHCQTFVGAGIQIEICRVDNRNPLPNNVQSRKPTRKTDRRKLE